MAWSLAGHYFPTTHPGWSAGVYWAMGAITALLFFASVVAHELAHSLVSQAHGVPVRDITLFIFGGAAQISEEPRSAGNEFLMALAGPATSLVIAAFSGLLWLVSLPASPPLHALAGWLAWINVGLALFNLIPGFPLDGGRVFRAIVWSVTSNLRRATQIATGLGRVVAYGFIFWGIWQIFGGNWANGLWIAFIGWFLETLAAVPTGKAAASAEEWIPTACWIGKQDCGMLARRVNGRVVKFEGHPDHPRNRGTLCPKGQAQIMAVYDPNRVKAPLLRTNEKGVPGQWRQISWDEALTLVAEKIKDVVARDKRLLIWQKGRSKAKQFYDDAFVKASGATKLHHGAFCSDAGYRACEYTTGLHGVMHPDFRHTRYLLAWGWNITGGGGNKFCWLTWPQQLIKAKERGIKVVAIDPRLRSAAHFADEWLPIRPATDLALALALCNALVEQGTVDWEYLKKYTNAAFLVKEDGYLLRVGEGEEAKELVWDETTGSAVAHDAEGVEPALEGEFTVDGATVKPAFQVFKEHMAQYTPEWATEVCGLPAEQVCQVAQELGENAMIGSTIEVDGMTLPYRPVAIMTYHVAQQELGFQLVRAQNMIMMLLGAIGAVGGTFTDFTWKIDKRYKGLDNIEITDSPNIYLEDSKFYPINSNNSSVVAKVMLDPEKYGVDYVPEVCIVHM